MFITKADITSAGIYEEILEALTREIGDTTTTVDAINQITIDEVASYLSSRYDTPAIFALTGSARNEGLLMKCIDISLYHIHCRVNPNVIPDIRVKRYDDAILWLQGVQRGEINPVGLPLLTNPDGEEGTLIYGSNTKRTNHY